MSNTMTDEEQGDGTNEQEPTQYETLHHNPGSSEGPSNVFSNHETHVSRETVDSYHIMKWKRLKKHYSDQYLDLFNSTFEDEFSQADPGYPDGQIGAVFWSTEEKKLLFTALDRFGRHDLPRIARAVKTKSQIEVKGYLDCLGRAHIDSHLFQSQTKNVSLPEIPAAVEIGEECEQALNEAADALSAFQEHYDVQAGLIRHGPDWIVDWAVAAKLDAAADEIEHLSEGQDVSQDTSSTDRHQLFHLSKMLSLSEQIFMKGSVDSDDDDDWQSTAEKGQRPALTNDVVDDIYELIVSQTQRILQAAIIIVKSHSGVYDESERLTSGDVTSEDIKAALDVLKMPHDARNFWTRLPRRSGLRVLSGSRGSKSSIDVAMSYDEVEAILSARELRGRRRFRSASMDRSSSEGADAVNRRNETSQEMSASDTADEYIDGETDNSLIDELDQSSDSQSERSSDDTTTGVADTHTRLNRNKRRKLLEDAREEYMERLDQRYRRREEAEMWQILGKEPEASMKHEEEELGVRPRSLRKTEEELQEWRCTYVSEWEETGRAVPEEEFRATARDKKMKVETGVIQ